jgi:hypothetical protein
VHPRPMGLIRRPAWPLRLRRQLKFAHAGAASRISCRVPLPARFAAPQAAAVLIPARARVSPVANTLHKSGPAT